MRIGYASAAIAILALGLTAAETGTAPRRWVRTAVRHEDGTPASTAFGPAQMTSTLARDIVAREMLRDSTIIGNLKALFQRVAQLGAGEEAIPTRGERTAYWTACGVYWEHLVHKAEGDVDLAAAFWRYGENAAKKHGSEAKLVEFLHTDDPQYLERFYRGL